MKKLYNKKLVMNAKLSPDSIETIMVKDKEYYKIPIAFLRDGIYNDWVYEPELLEKESIINAWNDVNIILKHQENEKDTIQDVNEKSLGRIYDVEVKKEDGITKLIGNAYLDVEKISEGLYNDIKNGMNISTCMWGRWRGRNILTDMIPRHIALLPDEEPAFSQEVGIGLMYNNNNKNITGDESMDIEEAKKILNSAKEAVNSESKIKKLEDEVADLKNKLKKANDIKDEEIEKEVKNRLDEKIENEKREKLYKDYDVSEKNQTIMNKLSIEDVEAILNSKEEDVKNKKKDVIKNSDFKTESKNKKYKNPTYKSY